jgi:hypothetical protein
MRKEFEVLQNAKLLVGDFNKKSVSERKLGQRSFGRFLKNYIYTNLKSVPVSNDVDMELAKVVTSAYVGWWE